MPLSPASWGVVGGDDEPPLLLKTLAARYPQHEFVIVGRNSGESPGDVGLPSNVTNPWSSLLSELKVRLKDVKGVDKKIAVYDDLLMPLFTDLDGLIVWTGQHGTSNSPIPVVGSGWEKVTQPQEAFVNYASYVIRGINAWRAGNPLEREEVWLCPDPRNYLKCRDLLYPPRHPVLGQFNFTKKEKHERYGDRRDPSDVGFEAEWEGDHVWVAEHRYKYSQLEVCGIWPEHIDARYADNFEERDHFGLFINEARSYVKHNRLAAMREYVLPLKPVFVHGKWCEGSLATIKDLGGPSIEPAPAEVYYDKLRSVKCTLTTPSSGSGWATTKPWQAFATGTVCFFHPEYDTQGHIIPTIEQAKSWAFKDLNLPHLALWLRVTSPEDLQKKVAAVSSSRETWEWLTQAQRALYDKASKDRRIIHHIAERLHI